MPNQEVFGRTKLQERGKIFGFFSFVVLDPFKGAYRGKNIFAVHRSLNKFVRQILLGQTLL